ncbi:MAG: fibronectin type III-like domain-contianing protein, partial [Clostridiaceae bacterium]
GVTLTFTVKNTGSRGAFAVPQLYIEDLESSVTRRVRELKAFTKVYLFPREEKQVTLSLTKESLAIFNEAREYAVEPGSFKWYLMDSGIEQARGAFVLLE